MPAPQPHPTISLDGLLKTLACLQSRHGHILIGSQLRRHYTPAPTNSEQLPKEQSTQATQLWHCDQIAELGGFPVSAWGRGTNVTPYPLNWNDAQKQGA